MAGTNPALLAGRPDELPGILEGDPNDPVIAVACFSVVIFIFYSFLRYTTLV